MIKTDEDALVCDLAETYHILDYKKIPPFKLGVLSVGLRDNSRIKMILSKSIINSDQVFLASILDCLKTLVWLNSSDGSKGLNRPKSTLARLLNKEEKENRSYKSGEEFERERNEIIKKIKKGDE